MSNSNHLTLVLHLVLACDYLGSSHSSQKPHHHLGGLHSTFVARCRHSKVAVIKYYRIQNLVHCWTGQCSSSILSKLPKPFSGTWICYKLIIFVSTLFDCNALFKHLLINFHQVWMKIRHFIEQMRNSFFSQQEMFFIYSFHRSR